MTRRLAAVAIAALTGVAACQQSEPEQPPVPVQAPAVDPATAPTPAVGYACESGATLQARYPDSATAELVYRGQTLALRSVEAASGARYTGSGVEWWTANRDGEESATLSRLGPDNQTGSAVMERCTRPTVGSTPTGPLPTPAPGGPLPAAAPCKGSQLKLSVEGGDAGAGNRVRNFALQNAGTQACTLTGYPTVTVQDDDGDVLTDIRAEQSPGSYFRQGLAPTPVTLPPQAKALFEVAWTVVPNEAQGQKTCPTAADIRVIAPADTAVITAPFEFSPCGNRIRVSPLRAAD